MVTLQVAGRKNCLLPPGGQIENEVTWLLGDDGSVLVRHGCVPKFTCACCSVCIYLVIYTYLYFKVVENCVLLLLCWWNSYCLLNKHKIKPL
jgi:hypothetical protein